MGKSEVSTSVVKQSEGLINKALIIISRCIDQMKFAAYMAVLFITFFHILLVLFCIIVYMVLCFVRFYEGRLISNAHSEISRISDHVFKQMKVGSKVQYFSYKLTYLFFDIVAVLFNTFFPT